MAEALPSWAPNAVVTVNCTTPLVTLLGADDDVIVDLVRLYF